MSSRPGRSLCDRWLRPGPPRIAQPSIERTGCEHDGSDREAAAGGVGVRQPSSVDDGPSDVGVHAGSRVECPADAVAHVCRLLGRQAVTRTELVDA